MSLLIRFLQVHLEVEGRLGHRVGQVVGHVNLQTRRQPRCNTNKEFISCIVSVLLEYSATA